MPEFKFAVTKEIGSLNEEARGWHKEFNMISWNDAEPKYDIRTWSGTEHKRMGKGISLTREELTTLRELIDKALSEE